MIIINTHTDGAHAAAHRTLASIPDPASEVRWHAVRGAAPAAHASEAQSHGPGFCSWYGDECLGAIVRIYTADMPTLFSAATEQLH